LSLLISPLLVGVLGLLIERFLIRKTYKGGHQLQLLLTFGLFFILNECVRIVWGSGLLTVDTPFLLSGSIPFMGRAYPVYRLFILGLAVLVLFAMALMLARTRVGIIIRAGVYDAEMVEALGNNVPTVFLLVFGAGAALAALAGVIAAPFMSVYLNMGGEALMDCFVVIVVGGFGSLLGALIASLMIGQLQSFGILWIPQLAVVFQFLLMALILVVRPTGLFGEGVSVSAHGGAGSDRETHRSIQRKGMGRVRIYQFVAGLVCVALLVLLPSLLSEARINLASEVLIYALFAISFNLLFGYTGILPFGHAAVFGIGAYCTGLIFNHFPNMHLLLTMLIVALAGLVGGGFIGLFVARLKGAYSALLSLAFQMFLFAVALKWRTLTNGDDGMGALAPALYLPVFGTISMAKISTVYYFALIVAAIGIVACYFFLKTPLGNSLVVIREKEARASFLGYDVYLTKLIAFSASGVLGALAGALFVVHQSFVSTSCLDMSLALSACLMVVIGGSGAFLGPVLGAAFYMVFQDTISRLTQHWGILMGVLFIVVVLYFQEGFISLFKTERIERVLGGKTRANEDSIKN
jgi:branched-chain amino acid transport system permease protein